MKMALLTSHRAAMISNLSLVRFLIILCSLFSLGGTTGMVFTIFDVFADLESWGRITVGRFNASSPGAGNGWPIPEMTSQNSQTMEITEIRLLDAKGQWVKSHRFDSDSRNFAVSNWETDKYDLYEESFRAHGRRIETIRLGELGGQLNMAVYVVTENATSGYDDVNVTRGDVQLVLEFLNLTEGCYDCQTLEVIVSFWGHARGESTSGSGVTELFMLPASTRVWLPSTMQLDGNTTHLPEGFLALQQKDGVLLATLRTPVFRSSAFYTATLRVGGESTAHLIKERPVHRVYGEETSSETLTTESPVRETTEIVKQKDDKNKNKQNVVHPEYRHVKDSSSEDHAPSKGLILGYYLTTIIFGICLTIFL